MGKSADCARGTSSRQRAGSVVAILAALATAGFAVSACAPKPDPNSNVECNYACDAGDSHLQCQLKIKDGPFTKKRWEVTCADISDPADVEAACDQACGGWSEVGTACVETVKNPDNSPKWEPFDCFLAGYLGTGGLPDPGTGSVGGGADGIDETASGAPAWEPGAYIVYHPNLDVYIIDQAMVDAIKAQPTLLALDGTTVVERSSGAFEFQDVTTDSLADLLGVANGDMTRSLNGHPLNTMEEALNAMAAVSDASSITLKVNRGGSIVTLDDLIR